MQPLSKMKNIAKCKSCGDIIESFHATDYVTCSCGEIGIDGGPYKLGAYAKDWKNFLRLDEDNKEVEVTVVDKMKDEDDTPLTRDEKMDMLQNMIESFDRLPDHAMLMGVTQADLASALLLIHGILKH